MFIGGSEQVTTTRQILVGAGGSSHVGIVLAREVRGQAPFAGPADQLIAQGHRAFENCGASHVVMLALDARPNASWPIVGHPNAP
jgi:hypothetical protein